mgnify:FL=1
MRSFLTSSQPGRRVSTFVQYANVELAIGYLRRAQALSPSVIASLATPEAQDNAVRDLWANFAAYFRALNVRPWGWARLRGRWERQIGQWYSEMVSCPMIGREINLHATRRNAPPGSYHEILFARRTTPLDMTGYGTQGAAGAWRDEAMRRYNAQYGVGNIPRRIRFGSQQAIERNGVDTAACASVGVETSQTSCLGPSGDVHPLWLTNAAMLGGGVNYPTDPVAAGLFDHHDCVARSIVDGTTNGPSLTSGPPGFNWCCGASGDPFGMGMSGRWNPYLPPRMWYALLVWPLVEYLSTVDPLRLIYEVQVDVSGKNLWTLISCGEDVSTIVSEGVLSGQIASDGLRGGLTRLTSLAGQGAGLVGLVNPLGGAVIGALAASLGLVVQLANISGNRRLDVFGRIEPAMDSLSIVNRARGTSDDAHAVDSIMPPGIAGVDSYDVPTAASVDQRVTITGQGAPVGRRSFSWLSNPASYAALAGSRTQSQSESSQKFVEPDEAIVRIVGMPQGGGVYLDGSSTPIDGQWEAGTDATVWVVPVPYGAHTLAVRSPDGQVRAARVSLNSGQTLTGEFATMQPVVPQPPAATGMSGAAKAGVAFLAAGAIGGGAYIFRKQLGIESFFRNLTGKR